MDVKCLRKYFVTSIISYVCAFLCIRTTATGADLSNPTKTDGHISDTDSATRLWNGANSNETQNGTDAVHLKCPSNVQCDQLGPDCIECDFNEYCVYGADDIVNCRPKPDVICMGLDSFSRNFNCRYCYQLDPGDYRCQETVGCSVTRGPRQMYKANCTADVNTLCMGRRTFHKMVPCNWTSGYKWSTALILSITLGGFGADRFYLGLWKEGIGKLFSFGGLGVWTIVDVILIAIGYVTPSDGSLYL